MRGEKCVLMGTIGGKNPFESERQKKSTRFRQGGAYVLDGKRPRNIPGIFWEQFSRQPGNDVSFPVEYISEEGASAQQTIPRASLSPAWTSRDQKRTQQDCKREYFTSNKTELVNSSYSGTWIPVCKKLFQDDDDFCCRYLPGEH